MPNHRLPVLFYTQSGGLPSGAALLRAPLVVRHAVRRGPAASQKLPGLLQLKSSPNVLPENAAASWRGLGAVSDEDDGDGIIVSHPAAPCRHGYPKAKDNKLEPPPGPPKHHHHPHLSLQTPSLPPSTHACK